MSGSLPYSVPHSEMSPNLDQGQPPNKNGAPAGAPGSYRGELSLFEVLAVQDNVQAFAFLGDAQAEGLRRRHGVPAISA